MPYPFLSFQRRVYVAAPLHLLHEARDVASAIAERGFAIASSWHALPDDPTPEKERGMTLEEQETLANTCLSEIRTSHALVLLVGPPTTRVGNIGEAFFARGQSKPVYVLRTGPDAILPTVLLWANGFEHPVDRTELLLSLGQGRSPA